jgi:hypothetical protein
VLATVGILIGAQHPAAQDKVTCNMAWPPQGSSIGIMVAEERGFFKEASLDVNIHRRLRRKPHGEGAGSRAVHSGTSTRSACC